MIADNMMTVEVWGAGWQKVLDYEGLTERLGSAWAERVWDEVAARGFAVDASGVHYLRGTIHPG